MEDDLVAWGRVVRIETRGRVSGSPARATVGFAERADGSIVVAAGSMRTQWAQNLLAEPRCRTTIAGVEQDAMARPLDGPEHAAAIRDLILKYGQPAESLGAGPAFELRFGDAAP